MVPARQPQECKVTNGPGEVPTHSETSPRRGGPRHRPLLRPGAQLTRAVEKGPGETRQPRCHRMAWRTVEVAAMAVSVTVAHTYQGSPKLLQVVHLGPRT